jgi:hypothetical protein
MSAEIAIEALWTILSACSLALFVAVAGHQNNKEQQFQQCQDLSSQLALPSERTLLVEALEIEHHRVSLWH